MRTRVRLLVQLTTRHGQYRRGLVHAAKGLTPDEAAVLADLEAHGLDVNQLRDVLCGGHVLVDNPDLYERWRFPKVTRERLSSHHKTVDKQSYPDLGMHGPLVREKLHGRTATGTWVQLEKTPAAFGPGHKLPTWNDVLHLVDFVVYRVTKRNVGPWGLSAATERRPMYLSPQLLTTVPLPHGTTRTLRATLARLDAEDQVVQDKSLRHSDLVRRFLGPLREDPLVELKPGQGVDGAGDSSAIRRCGSASLQRPPLTGCCRPRCNRTAGRCPMWWPHAPSKSRWATDACASRLGFRLKPRRSHDTDRRRCRYAAGPDRCGASPGQHRTGSPWRLQPRGDGGSRCRRRLPRRDAVRGGGWRGRTVAGRPAASGDIAGDGPPPGPRRLGHRRGISATRAVRRRCPRDWYRAWSAMADAAPSAA